MIGRQLELRLANQTSLQQTCRRRRGRPSRANWWFEQMREAANDARDWPGSTAQGSVRSHSNSTPIPGGGRDTVTRKGGLS